MAAADIFTEVLALARSRGARASTFVGRAGVGDLVATALAPQSRNRSAGELLAEGIPAAEIPARLGQAVEALETVPALARSIEPPGLEAPPTAPASRRPGRQRWGAWSRAGCRSTTGSTWCEPCSLRRPDSAARAPGGR